MGKLFFSIGTIANRIGKSPRQARRLIAQTGADVLRLKNTRGIRQYMMSAPQLEKFEYALAHRWDHLVDVRELSKRIGVKTPASVRTYMLKSGIDIIRIRKARGGKPAYHMTDESAEAFVRWFFKKQAGKRRCQQKSVG
jgi:hypothetical protein